ncbi:MAG TPA: NlpC/P60 family protein [Rhabdochlamydiaceae bacterium]|jgi:cell wall-associated NlpC family hydrolase|nr:NlpC/P60 family protein [Rhabdochlamydiaceae bacterium]
MTFAVVRFSHDLPIDQQVLDDTVAELKHTSYQRTVSLKEAPAKTDCVTAVHYLLQKAFQIKLPRGWVGDMPRLLSQSQWGLYIVDASELKTGDLLFLKQKQQPKLISHIAIVLAPDQIFHCTGLLGPLVQSVDQVFERYEQQLKKDLIRYIDCRNTSLREQHGGMYIKA